MTSSEYSCLEKTLTATSCNKLRALIYGGSNIIRINRIELPSSYISKVNKKTRPTNARNIQMNINTSDGSHLEISVCSNFIALLSQDYCCLNKTKLTFLTLNK